MGHKLRCFGVGQRRMMPHDPFWPPWKLFAQLFRELGWISKVCVINIRVLRNDRFDSSADTISCLALLNPNWSEHLVDVTGLDLRNGEFSERRVSVPFERRWPLITML